MIESNDGGASVSTNGGASWTPQSNQPTAQFYHAITDNRFPYWVYGAQQDSGAAGVPSRTNTIDGISEMEFREITAGGQSDKNAPDPHNPGSLYSAQGGQLHTQPHQTPHTKP